jgi:hypothetical protein
VRAENSYERLEANTTYNESTSEILGSNAIKPDTREQRLLGCTVEKFPPHHSSIRAMSVVELHLHDFLFEVSQQAVEISGLLARAWKLQSEESGNTALVTLDGEVIPSGV